MELIKILRELSRRRRLVAVVLGFSLLVGLLLAFHPGIPPQSRQYRVALASSEILVDTRHSQVATVGGRGPDLPTLTSRADLLANLMTSGPLKDAIAKSAGIAPDALVVVPPPNPNTPGVAPAPVETPVSREIPSAEATMLSLSIDETLPIIHVVAQAPDLVGAQKLSGAVIVGIKSYLGSVAASQDIPAAHRLVVRQFGARLAGTTIRGLPRRFAVLAAIALALFGCGAIVGGSWFVSSWKQVEEAEARGRLDESDDESSESVPPAEPTVLRANSPPPPAEPPARPADLLRGQGQG